MKLLEELRAEHAVIERTLGALATYVEARLAGAGDPADAGSFLAFFREWAGRYHHAREEDTLFPALLAHLPIRPDSGPVRSLADQHAAIARTLEEMAPVLRDPGEEGTASWTSRRGTGAPSSPTSTPRTRSSCPRARRVSAAPGSRTSSGARRMPDERAARDGAERLWALYPPREDSGAIRGEGCVICPSYGLTCEGLEREWWSEQEWDDFRERDG